ncbi:MAG TPA: right-handed parallel beta-helix repeat-containing protein [Solirubrobacteraceae bacterium]|nr:right-handed parallel beta-helix repeat-containing protein [Solirubrobacteraceae bacterium]
MFTARTRSIIGACAVLCGLAAPAAANAASVYVSNSSPVVAGGKSCTQPNYSTVQGAIDALKSISNPTINVCPGTYTEQLTITKALKLSVAGTAGSAKVVLPASPADTKTECDEAPGTGEFQPDQDGISICTPGTVSITGLTVEAKWAGNVCDDSLYGILVAGGATLKASNVTIDGAGAFPINGCQGGVGIQVGMHWTKPAEIGHATLKGVTVENYQKNGITVESKGSTATIGTTIVKGAGATPETAQNGIQVSGEGQAKIKSSKISGNECDVSVCGPEGFSQEQATGLLFYGAAAGSSVTSSTLEGNDIGAYYKSFSASQPTSPELSLSKDTFSGNRYEGVALDQGEASLKTDTINGPGEVGIEIYQYASQSLASESSASNVKIEGVGTGVRVASDKAAGDKPGRFKFSKSTFTNDTTVLNNESSNFEVIF